MNSDVLSKYLCRPRLYIFKLLTATGCRAKVFSILVSWNLTILDRQVFSFFLPIYTLGENKHLRRAKIESRCAKDPKDHSYHLTIVLRVTSILHLHFIHVPATVSAIVNCHLSDNQQQQICTPLSSKNVCYIRLTMIDTPNTWFNTKQLTTLKR